MWNQRNPPSRFITTGWLRRDIAPPPGYPPLPPVLVPREGIQPVYLHPGQQQPQAMAPPQVAQQLSAPLGDFVTVAGETLNMRDNSREFIRKRLEDMLCSAELRVSCAELELEQAEKNRKEIKEFQQRLDAEMNPVVQIVQQMPVIYEQPAFHGHMQQVPLPGYQVIYNNPQVMHQPNIYPFPIQTPQQPMQSYEADSNESESDEQYDDDDEFDQQQDDDDVGLVVANVDEIVENVEQLEDVVDELVQEGQEVFHTAQQAEDALEQVHAVEQDRIPIQSVATVTELSKAVQQIGDAVKKITDVAQLVDDPAQQCTYADVVRQSAHGVQEEVNVSGSANTPHAEIENQQDIVFSTTSTRDVSANPSSSENRLALYISKQTRAFGPEKSISEERRLSESLPRSSRNYRQGGNTSRRPKPTYFEQLMAEEGYEFGQDSGSSAGPSSSSGPIFSTDQSNSHLGEQSLATSSKREGLKRKSDSSDEGEKPETLPKPRKPQAKKSKKSKKPVQKKKGNSDDADFLDEVYQQNAVANQERAEYTQRFKEYCTFEVQKRANTLLPPICEDDAPEMVMRKHLSQFIELNKKSCWMNKKSQVERLLTSCLKTAQTRSDARSRVQEKLVKILIENLNKTIIQDVLYLQYNDDERFAGALDDYLNLVFAEEEDIPQVDNVGSTPKVTENPETTEPSQVAPQDLEDVEKHD